MPGHTLHLSLCGREDFGLWEASRGLILVPEAMVTKVCHSFPRHLQEDIPLCLETGYNHFITKSPFTRILPFYTVHV
jgi:hypothetical protein